MAKKAKVLTTGDVKLILAIADSKPHAERNRCVFMVSLLAGLRAVELANLTIGSVLGGDGRILDRMVFAKHQTKGNKARSVPVSKRLAKELASYVATLHPRAVQPERPLFASQKGGGFSAHGIVMLLGRLYKSASIIGASSHSGRLSFASRLAEQGVSVFVLKELMGHENISTTSGYVTTGNHLLVNAVELL
jgi:integrase/recombinase XerD